MKKHISVMQCSSGDMTEQINDIAKKIVETSDTVEQMSGIVNSIENIANQTNLLALNASIEAARAGEMRETKWLSAGYQDLLGICMRLALVDAMYPKEKPFLVLDDPFVNLDEEKMAHGNELFGKISGEYQILYFTCHASRNIENTK